MTPGSSQMPPDEDSGTPNDDALSPTDGYFHALPPLPQDELIPDPEQRNTPASKEQEAREAQEERARRASRRLGPASSQRHHSPAASSIVSASSQRSVDTTIAEPDDQRPHRPRLPTYDDAVAERPYVGPSFIPTSSGHYGTTRPSTALRTDIRPGDTREVTAEETQPLLPSRDGNEDLERGGWRDRFLRWRVLSKTKFRRKLRKILLCLLLISIIAVLLKISISINEGKKGDSDEPPTQPPDGTPSDAHKLCPSWSYRHKESLKVEAADVLSFAQVTSNRQPDWGRAKRICQGGEIQVKGSSSVTDVSVRIDLYASHSSLSQHVRLDKQDRVILFALPAAYSGSFKEEETLCIYAVAHVVIPSNTNFTALYVVSEAMDIVVDESLDFGAGTKTFNLTTLDGRVRFPPNISQVSSLRARDISVATEAGTITGAYPLHDSLYLASSRGSVDVQISLNEADSSNPKPAELTVGTNAGDIRVIQPEVQSARRDLQVPNGKHPYIPVRDYRSIIHNIAGNIRADLVHGSKTEIGGKVGSMDITMSPHGSKHQESMFRLKSTSSSADFRLTHRIDDPTAAIDNLTTIFEGATGSLRLAFPDTWQGTVESYSVTGNIMTEWPGLHVQRRGKDPFHVPFSSLSGYVGTGNSLLSSQTISGNTKLIGYGRQAKQW